MATRKGVVKKTALSEYSRPRQGGLIGIALDDDDTLIDVVLTHPGEEMLLCHRRAMAIRFDEADARAMGRNTYGVKGIKLGLGDEVVGLVVAAPDGFLLTVCENGYGKRTPFGPNTAGVEDEAEETDEAAAATPEPAEEEGAEVAQPASAMRYRKQRRGGKGVRDIRTTDRNGPVVGGVPVRDGDDVVLITTSGMVNRTHAHEIRVVGRNTQGVRIMSLREGDKIASVATVAHEEGGETPPVDGEPTAEPTA